MSWKTSLLGVALGGLLMFGGATGAQARDCRDNVRKWEWKLQRDIDRHGFYSRQAQHDRHELGEAPNGCRRWDWDRNSRRWNDHDRDDGWYRGADGRWHRRW